MASAAAMVLLALAPASAKEALAPAPDQEKTCRLVVRALLKTHFGHLEVDDAFSARLLDRYLDRLDPSRLFLLQPDVTAFQRWRSTLDDALRVGDLDAAYVVFNRFQQRREQWLGLQRSWLDTRLAELTFDGSEDLELDREDAPWLPDEAAARELWWLQFKNDVLNLRLAERSQEDIREVLAKRYDDRLRRVGQVNSGDVFRLFMNAVTSCFGPHTEYFPPHDAENFDIQLSLTFEGIGALLGVDGEYCKVERIIPGGPADKDGRLRPGDRIVAVGEGDGRLTEVVGWRNDEIVDLIRGPKGTVVRLGVLPAGVVDHAEMRIVDLHRDEVRLEEQAATSRVIERERNGRTWRLGVVHVPAFYLDFDAYRRGARDFKSATRDVAKLLGQLIEQDVDGIVMDLRGNGGGSLVEAHELTSLFLGKAPVVQVRDAAGKVEVLTSEAPRALYDGPLVVLVDRLSASASEIFAAAVQDTGRGVIVGQRTFGKGTVQRLVPVEDGKAGQLKITQAKFYRISGGSTQHAGVVPDVELPPLYDPEKIGESALEDPMEWDRIQPVPHAVDSTIARMRPELNRMHKERVSDDPEFQHVVELLTVSRRLAQDTTVSLNEAQRRKEQEAMRRERLEIENRLRVAKGEEPLASWDEQEEESDLEGEAEPDVKEEPDPFAVEACEILIDLVMLRESRPV